MEDKAIIFIAKSEKEEGITEWNPSCRWLITECSNLLSFNI